MHRLVVLAVIVALLLPAGAGAALDRGRLLIDTGARVVTVRVEIADEPAEQATGLMRRKALGRDAGMLFAFPSDRRGGFWMKNTLIPLSIAFADRRGVIRRILVMTPCRHDPCRVYDPGIAYRSALEVNRGAFARWGVTQGDRLRLAQ